MVDNSASTELSLTEHPYDTHLNGVPVVGVSPFAEPLSMVCLNNAWWGFIAGVLDRLTWIDAWNTDDPEEAQDYAELALQVIDAVGQFLPTRCDFCKRWLGADADPTLETGWTLTTGQYWLPTNEYFSVHTVNYDYFDLTIPVNAVLTSVEYEFEGIPESGNPNNSRANLYIDGVIVDQKNFTLPTRTSCSWNNSAPAGTVRPTWVTTIRIEGWVADADPNQTESFLRIVRIEILGWGINSFVAPGC